MHIDYQPPVDESLFVLESVIDWKYLFELEVFDHMTPDIARSVLEEGGKFAVNVLAPLNQVGDEQGSVLVNGNIKTPDGFPAAFKQYAKNGWAGLDLPEQFGGQRLPLTLQVAFSEMVNGANVSFGMFVVMLRAAAWLMIEHADQKLIDIVVPRLTNGDWSATICISEAQAGSDVSRIRTKAEPLANDQYNITGTKMFITFGDHDLTDQIVHLVLARTPNAPVGTRGLSLFAVPKFSFEGGERNSVFISHLEKKMGLKASPTCVLNLDNAIGYRIGVEGRGLSCMFAMVKLMRLEVSIQGVGIGEAAAGEAWRYAINRQQGGPATEPPMPIIRHPDVQRMLFDMQSRTNAMRALVFETAFQLDLSQFAKSAEVRKTALGIAEFLLPVCKSYGSDIGFRTANTAIQVLGGHGYISDSGVEQYARDSRVMSIYEGTNGIQALDLVMRKLLRNDGIYYQCFIDKVKRSLAECRGKVAAELFEPVDAAVDALEEATQYILRIASRSRDNIESTASDYLQLVGLVSSAWIWVRIAAVAKSGSHKDDMRKLMAQFYADYVLPEYQAHVTRIYSGRGVLRLFQANEMITRQN